MTFNSLVIAILVVAGSGWIGIDIDEETANLIYMAIVLPVANMVLRVFTKKPLTQKERLLE